MEEVGHWGAYDMCVLEGCTWAIPLPLLPDHWDVKFSSTKRVRQNTLLH